MEVSALSTTSDGKRDVYAYESVKQGQPLAAVLADVVALALKAAGAQADALGRPGCAVRAPGTRSDHVARRRGGAGRVLGLHSGQSTRGHRFLSQGEVTVANADAYARTLHESGKVVASSTRVAS